MRKLAHLILGTGAVLGLSLLAAPLGAGADGLGGPSHGFGPANVVFVQTDNPAGNQVVAYDRSYSGGLSLANTYSTGGLGGVLNGSAVDHLAAQGSLTYDRTDNLLYAVNAGSNSISVFSVYGDQLQLRQVVGSGGTFPVSVAAQNGLVYVLNALGNGSVTGFRAVNGRLFAIPGSTRSLGLTIPTNTTQFTHTPGQVVFSPSGSQLIVTTKATTNAIDVFGVAPGGWLSGSPIVNSEPGTVPFGVTFDRVGNLVVAEAGTDAVATFNLHWNGVATLIDTVGTGQAATCWVAPAQGYFYASNAGSASLSGYAESFGGQLRLLTPPSATDPGTVDASTAANGQFLYVQTGKSGIVDGFRVNFNGSLTKIGSVTVAGAVGGEGIVAF